MKKSLKSLLKGSTALTLWSSRKSAKFAFMQAAGFTGIAGTLYALGVPAPDLNNIFSPSNLVTITEALSKAGTHPFTVGVGGYFMGRWAIGRPLITLWDTYRTRGAGLRYGVKEMSKNVARIVIGVPTTALACLGGLSLSSLFSQSARDAFDTDKILDAVTTNNLFETTRDYSVENLLQAAVTTYNQTASVILHAPAAFQNGEGLGVAAAFTCAATLAAGLATTYKSVNALGDRIFGKDTLVTPWFDSPKP